MPPVKSAVCNDAVCSIIGNSLVVQQTELKILLDLCAEFIGEHVPNPELAGRLQNSNEIDWDLLINLSAYHCVTPIVARVLNDHFPDVVPAQASQKMARICKDVARRSFALTGELIKIQRLFEDNDVPFLTMKGATLAESLYGDIVLRDFRDIDLLIEKAHAAAVYRIMINEGLTPRGAIAERELDDYMHFCGQLAFERDSASPLIVDVHWELHSFKPGAKLFENQQFTSVCGRTFKTLSPELMLLFLCTHGSIDYWARLRLVVDVAMAIKKLPINWPRLMLLANELAVQKQLRSGMTMASQVCKISSPLQEFMQTPGFIKIEEKILLSQLNVIVSTYANLDPVMEEQKSLSLKIEGVNRGTFVSTTTRLFKILFVPDLADWLAFRLPAKLFFLYCLIRPLRVIADKISRMARTKAKR